MSFEGLRAAIFDVDGVLVASPHERAWREALAEVATTHWGSGSSGTFAPERFTSAVYQEHVAGKARMSGARAVLDYFRVPDADRRAAEYARHKQRRLELLLEAGDFLAFPDALRFVLALRARGFLLAVASSSKNANRFMERIRLDLFARDEGRPDGDARPGETLLQLFDANVCGRELRAGKPDPEIFVLAARELGVSPSSCVVIEDAPAGIEAAKAGGMAAIGIARLGDEALLDAAGADLVVTTLDAVAFDPLVTSGRIERARRGVGEPDHVEHRIAAAMEPHADARWMLRQEGYSPLSETGIESRFSISNGFLGVCGSREASRCPMWMSFLHSL